MIKKLAILAIMLIFLSPTILVYAEESDSLPDEYEDTLDSIPNDIADLLPDEIFSLNSNDIASGAQKIVNWNYIIDYIFDILGLNLKQIVQAFAKILSILIMCSLLNLLRKSLNNPAIDGIVGLVGHIAIVCSLMEISKEPISKGIMLLDQLKIYVNTMSPTITAMYAMGGNINTALVQNYGLIVFLSILENICIISLEFIIGICMALTLSSAFVKDVNLLALSNGIKKIFTFLWSFVAITFTTVVSAQSLLSNKADSLTSKTAKILVGHIIPLAGGTVGESLKTVGASIEYLRSNVGIIFIIILALTILPTIVSISLYRLTFIISNSIAGILGCEGEGKIIIEISSIFGYLLAIISVCSIILLFLITIFAKCSSPLS